MRYVRPKEEREWGEERGEKKTIDGVAKEEKEGRKKKGVMPFGPMSNRSRRHTPGLVGEGEEWGARRFVNRAHEDHALVK